METVKETKKTLDPRDPEQLALAFEYAKQIVTKNYLSNLNAFKVIDTKAVDYEELRDNIALLKLSKLVYNKNESTLQLLTNIFGTAAALKKDVAFIINNDGEKTEIYYGLVNTEDESTVADIRSNAESLKKSYEGNFLGTDIQLLDNVKMHKIMQALTSDDINFVTSVSAVASTRTDQEQGNIKYTQGLEKLLDAMAGIKFSTIIIAKYIDADVIDRVRAELENLYNKLQPFAKSELSFNESSANAVNETLMNSLCETFANNESTTLGIAKTSGKSHTDSKTDTNTYGVGGSIMTGLTTSVFGAISTSVAGLVGPAIVGVGLSVGGSIARSLMGGLNLSYSKAKSKGTSDTLNEATSNQESSTKGSSESKGETKGTTRGTSVTDTSGRAIQIFSVDKPVLELLERIDEQLKRLKDGGSYGMFASAAYFLADNITAVKIAATTFKGLISGDKTKIEIAEINSWEKREDVEVIKKYLSKLQHPLFSVNDGLNTVSAATLVNGKELAVEMGLPLKSVHGVEVVETVPFGRNIKADQGKKVVLGNLYHMGREEGNSRRRIPVQLDVNGLSAHTFITGSTGSGKSNTVYKLLDSLTCMENEGDIHFLVIEPAKGEYKHHYGYRHNVNVYGTNYKKSPLLQIDPFSFPEDVLVLEHIERLVEIFNVCWPMYAAMPAVLKDAVEQAYIKVGWNLVSSEYKYKKQIGKNLYPTFEDVLEEIHRVIEKSEYSSDTKGDYIGALVTRLKSLTNGLYRQIFTAKEIPFSELFDKNVVIDLSRVGSGETKTLLMGLIVLKLNEYRMSEGEPCNNNLKHVTVLEEAHNLLRRTSTEQSQEGANLLGKGVEMLRNAIAEMRTYGEGFIIADQAPELLDKAVIRNTNTKIILRLPDYSDRELVGKAAALNDEQIVELSRLDTGVAAVYQNNWQESVLCKVTYVDTTKDNYSFDYKKGSDLQRDNLLKVVKLLLIPTDFRLSKEQLAFAKNKILGLDISSELKIEAIRFFENKGISDLEGFRGRILYKLFKTDEIVESSLKAYKGAGQWYSEMINSLDDVLDGLDEVERVKILTIMVCEYHRIHKTELSKNICTEVVDYLRGGLNEPR